MRNAHKGSGGMAGEEWGGVLGRKGPTTEGDRYSMCRVRMGTISAQPVETAFGW